MAFADPVKPQRCTTGPVEPPNKGACGAKLLLMTVSTYPGVTWTVSVAICHAAYEVT